MSEPLRISEIFGPTLQGEGALIGRPTVFVRTGGCDFRCAWCDTLHAVLPKHRGEWRRMDAAEVQAELRRLSPPILVTLSGGNPALQDLSGLIELGQAEGYTFNLETQGSVARPWFARLDHLTLSPKPPSAGVATDLETVRDCVEAAAGGPETHLKIVVLDEEDFVWARTASDALALPTTLQVCNDRPGASDRDALLARWTWLAQRVRDTGWTGARVLPQLHVLAWGDRRGV